MTTPKRRSLLTSFLTPKRYDKHPFPFYMGFPSPVLYMVVKQMLQTILLKMTIRTIQILNGQCSQRYDTSLVLKHIFQPKKNIFSMKPCYFLLIKSLQYINKLDNIPISTIWTISKDFQRFSQSCPQATQMQTFPNIFLKFSKDSSAKIVEESQEHPKICFDHIVGFEHMYS